MYNFDSSRSLRINLTRMFFLVHINIGRTRSVFIYKPEGYSLDAPIFEENNKKLD